MARDFREELYRGYVTSLKTSQIIRDERKIKELWIAYQYRYLPHLTGLSREMPILELGCGPGYFLEFLQKRNFQNAEGVDISEEQVKMAASRGLRAHLSDAFEYLDSKKEWYGAITAIDFIEHFTKEELLALFSKIQKALKPGGLLIIQTPNGQGLFPGQVIYGDLTHMTIFSEDSLRQLLRVYEFCEIRFYETAPVAYGLDGRIRSVSWKLVKQIIRLVRQIEAKNSSKLWTENLICVCKKSER